ncbi:hypothetical protein D1872_294010 [compost metagenome]
MSLCLSQKFQSKTLNFISGGTTASDLPDEIGCCKEAFSRLMSDDKNIISLIAAEIAAFLFYEIKFLSKPNDKNFISSPILTRILSHFQQTNSGYCTISR